MHSILADVSGLDSTKASKEEFDASISKIDGVYQRVFDLVIALPI